jgi:hypothetical protein
MRTANRLRAGLLAFAALASAAFATQSASAAAEPALQYVNQAWGRCLAVSDDDSAPAVLRHCGEGGPWQRWRQVDQDREGWFVLENAATRTCLTVTQAGSPARTEPCSLTAGNQRWRAHEIGNNNVVLRNFDTRTCLDAPHPDGWAFAGPCDPQPRLVWHTV